ncbi:hypothetical protein BGX34_001494 [Mortierella sp. NVP85]|nr:hypothetical protein BGX34_001494 [Mortierella sp. NVP85]
MSGDSQGSASENAGSPIVHLHAKSRWKSEYLRVTSSSPSGSFISTISEIMPEILPEILPEIMPKMILSDNDTHESSPVFGRVMAKPITSEVPLSPSSPIATPTITTEATMTDKSKDSFVVPAGDGDGPGDVIKRGPENAIDPVEQDILAKLEELRKEKSRLFSLFRASVNREQERRTPELQSTSTASSITEASESSTTEMMLQDNQLPLLSSLSMDASKTPLEARPLEMNGSATVVESNDMKQASARKLSDQDYDKKIEPLRSNGKRREHERVIDRSKLNLEIPRKPSVSSVSSSSTTSTPTPTSAGFALPSSSSSSSYVPKGKRPRSNSPSFMESPRGPGAGSLGPFFSSSSSSYSESPSKYPRADYVGSHNRNPSNGNDIHHHHHHHLRNGLPEKPQIRHHHSASLSSSSARGLGGDGYHGDEGYHHRHKSGSGPPSSLFPGMNGSGGSGLYRRSGPPVSYLPPTRIGFGNSSSSGGGSGSSGSRGYYGSGGDGGSNGSTISKPAPPLPPHHQGRPLPFGMQMPHPRASMGGSRSGFGGGRGGGGLLDRPMDWPRRRGRT